MANRKNTFNKTKIAGIASAMMLASADISALGLGVLDVQSNLDQPLNGVIELRVNAGDDISSVKASIASQSDFANLGIDYPSYLDNVNVTVDRSSGAPRLRIDSSNVIIKEPFIHILMRVDWSGGSFLREYTALIDPPVYAAETPKSISTPKFVGSDQVRSRPSPVVSSHTRGFTDTSYSGQSYTSSTDAQYGPVEAGETLSIIASQLSDQYPDLSIYQIMKVLFEQNPSAFIKGNINGLIKGSVLNVGDINAIRAVDIQVAKDFFARQAADWSGRVASNNIKVSQNEYNDSADGLIESPSDSLRESFQVGASVDTESLISDSDSNTSDGEAILLKQQVSELESSLSSSAQENQDLKERISNLEAQLTDMRDLVDLGVKIDDVDLANLENKLSKVDEPEVSPELAAALENSTSGTDDVVGLDTNPLGVDASNPLLEGSEDPLLDSGLNPDINGDSLDAPVDGLSLEPSIDDAATSVVESVEKVKPKPVITKPEPSFFEKIKNTLFGGGLWTWVGGLGAVLVAALGVFFVRRRRADEEFEISMLSIESNSESINTINDPSLSRSMSASVTASVNEGGDGDGSSVDQETSFLTVYSDSDAVVQADEVDPIAEADVYIAYGRHVQAEEVLLDGMNHYPERLDIKHKLLTVYHKNNNIEGFERIAEELYSKRETLDPQIWQEVCVMGKEIDESNPLFELSVTDIAAAGAAATIGAAAVSAMDAEPSVETLDDLGLSLDEGQSDKANEIDGESIHLTNFDEGRSEISELDEVAIDALDFDAPITDIEDVLSDGDIDVQLDVDEVLESDDELTVIDIEDDQLEFTADDLNGEIEIDGLEFNSDSNVADAVEVDSSLISEDEIADIDFAFDDSDLEGDLSGDLDISLDSDLDISLDSGLEKDLDSDLDDDDFNIGELQEVSDLEVDEDYDELRTQFELAKVFADLGDEDGAQKILTDIIADDNAAEDLVNESKELLATIS